MKKNLIFLAIAASIALASCSNEEATSPANQVTEDYYVEDGILNIKDYDIFNQLAYQASLKTNEEQQVWEDSMKFTSFSTLYHAISNEYEDIVNTAGSEDEFIQRLDLFLTEYSRDVYRPQLQDEGEADYSIATTVASLYLDLANEDGLIKIGNELIDTKNIISSKSVDYSSNYSCTAYKSGSKKKDQRKMIVTTTMSNGYISHVQVTNKRWILWGWSSYGTPFYWQTTQFEISANVYYNQSNSDVESGEKIWMPGMNGVVGDKTKLLRIWNRGVGESNACTFSY